MGSIAKSKSVKALKLLLKNAANFKLAGGMHCPVVIAPHIWLSGLHWKKTVKKLPAQESMVRTIKTQISRMYVSEGVSRSRKSPTLILVSTRPMRHSGCVTKLRWRPLVIFDGGSIYCQCLPAPSRTSGMMIMYSANIVALRKVSRPAALLWLSLCQLTMAATIV